MSELRWMTEEEMQQLIGMTTRFSVKHYATAYADRTKLPKVIRRETVRNWD